MKVHIVINSETGYIAGVYNDHNTACQVCKNLNACITRVGGDISGGLPNYIVESYELR